MSIGEQIRERRNFMKLKQDELANSMGVSTKTVQRWESNQQSPRTKELIRLATVLHTTVAFLSGEADNFGRPVLEEQPVPESNVRTVKTVKIPLIKGVIKACCGKGNAYVNDIQYEIQGSIDIPASELEGYAWQVGPGGFHTMQVEGDSMEPRIHDGETILYGDLPYNNGNFVLVRYDDRLIVRGIWNDHNGHYRLRAVNPDYEDIEVDTSDESKDFYILGKVIRVISIRSVADGMM